MNKHTDVVINFVKFNMLDTLKNVKEIKSQPKTAMAGYVKSKDSAISVTDKIFNAINWQDHFTVKERQSFNDKVDEIVEQAHLDAAREERREVIEEIRRKILDPGIKVNVRELYDWVYEILYSLKEKPPPSERKPKEDLYGVKD